MNLEAGQLPVTKCGKVPIPVTNVSQDRPFALMDQEAKAAHRIASSFALTWPASVQRNPTYRTSN
jgi:hypothetical protein